VFSSNAADTADDVFDALEGEELALWAVSR
jgi:hypothetical protein